MEHRPDIARVTEFLTTYLGHAPTDVTAVGSGAWSTAFAFTDGDRALIIRFGLHRDDFSRDRVASRFSSDDLPIPQVIAIGHAAPFARDFAISTRAYGHFIDLATGSEMQALLPSLFATLDAMRAADLSALSGFGAWDASGNAWFSTWREALLDIAIDRPDHRTHGWRTALETSPVGARIFDESYLRLITTLDDLRDVEIERHLIHSDLLNFNVFVEGDRIASVFDWGCAMTGDHLYDLAWFVFWQPWYPEWRALDFVSAYREHLAAQGIVEPAFETRLRACLLHIGLADQAYNASLGRWGEITTRGARMMRIA